MQDTDGFQREHRVEPAPPGASQFPGWAKWAVICALALGGVAIVALLLATGGLSFVR